MGRSRHGFHKLRSLEEEQRRGQFGDFTQRRRWDLEVSQEHVAKRAGLSQPQISRIEQGLHLPQDQYRLKKYADALELDGQQRIEFFKLAGYTIDPLSDLTDLDPWLDIDFLTALVETSQRVWYENAEAERTKTLLHPITTIPTTQSAELIDLKGQAILQLSDVAGWEGRLFIEGGMYDLGAELLRLGRLINDPSTQARGLYHMGTAYANANRYEKALKLYEMATSLELPREEVFNIERGLLIAAGELGKEDTVHQLATKSLQDIEHVRPDKFHKSMDPDRGDPPYNRLVVIGRVYTKLNKYDEAAKILAQAFQQSKDYQRPFTRMLLLVTMTEHYYQRGDLSTAEFFQTMAYKHGRKYGLIHQLKKIDAIAESKPATPRS